MASLGVLVSAGACIHQEEATYPAQESATMAPSAGPAAARHPSAKSSPAAGSTRTAVDHAVIAALNGMGAFLRAQRSFAVRSETATDEVLDTGQKIQLGEIIEMWVRRPNGLRVNYVAFVAPPTLGDNVHRDIDVDVDYHHHHPVATAVGVAAATTVTAAAIGSIVHSVPPSCSTRMINGFTYKNCEGTWYQPRYSGTQVNYVVVNPPG